VLSLDPSVPSLEPAPVLQSERAREEPPELISGHMLGFTLGLLRVPLEPWRRPGSCVAPSTWDFFSNDSGARSIDV